MKRGKLFRYQPLPGVAIVLLLAANLNASVSGNSGLDPDQAARKWLHANNFDHPMES